MANTARDRKLAELDVKIDERQKLLERLGYQAMILVDAQDDSAYSQALRESVTGKIVEMTKAYDGMCQEIDDVFAALDDMDAADREER